MFQTVWGIISSPTTIHLGLPARGAKLLGLYAKRWLSRSEENLKHQKRSKTEERNLPAGHLIFVGNMCWLFENEGSGELRTSRDFWTFWARRELLQRPLWLRKRQQKSARWAQITRNTHLLGIWFGAFQEQHQEDSTSKDFKSIKDLFISPHDFPLQKFQWTQFVRSLGHRRSDPGHPCRRPGCGGRAPKTWKRGFNTPKRLHPEMFEPLDMLCQSPRVRNSSWTVVKCQC